MSKQIRMDVVINAIIGGIKQAQIDYALWSGGDWLWSAPEYLLTTYVARYIDAIEGPKLITLEHSTKKAMDDAGAITRGCMPKKIRPKGRVDLILWRANGTPRGLLELKNQVRTYSVLAKDVNRIDKMLHKNHTGSHFQFGCVAFYSSAKTDNKGNAENKLKDALQQIENEAKNHRSNVVKKIKLYKSKTFIVEDSAWLAACLVLSK